MRDMFSQAFTALTPVRVHTSLLLVWAITIPLAFVFNWWDSVPFIALASIYANMATHWSAREGAKAEQQAKREGDAP